MFNLESTMIDSNSTVIDEHISSTYKTVSNLTSQNHITTPLSGKSWVTLTIHHGEKKLVVIVIYLFFLFFHKCKYRLYPCLCTSLISHSSASKQKHNSATCHSARLLLSEISNDVMRTKFQGGI